MDQRPETDPTLASVKHVRPRRPSTETLGERLRRFRQARGLTQAELARRVGISRRMMAYYEIQGGSPSSELLRKLADVLDVAMDVLAGRQETRKPLSPPESPRLLKRLKRLEELPPHDQKAVLHMIDMMAAGRRKAS